MVDASDLLFPSYIDMMTLVLRRGKELVENELENGPAAEAMTGEELKIQVRSCLPSENVECSKTFSLTHALFFCTRRSSLPTLIHRGQASTRLCNKDVHVFCKRRNLAATTVRPRNKSDRNVHPTLKRTR